MKCEKCNRHRGKYKYIVFYALACTYMNIIFLTNYPIMMTDMNTDQINRT